MFDRTRHSENTREQQLTPLQRWQNDAEMALAASRDYPKATVGLVLAVGALAFVAGYLTRGQTDNV
jgi:hypothetical protein